ncbi:conjugative transposon protein TraM [Mucilaginibacter sp. HMF5004]|uniref:conjugative transposon protein TraM n=1 Tax=Mucilaginibacter rivuli TaxID=2857527 RepID=UPI001C5EEDFD|nr:conjugative transposon protein TraM [Mucilaginibacter rivuli]MBW4888963.1 conjugative transposon protein TraM [Mucilaginibacter rivuli]
MKTTMLTPKMERQRKMMLVLPLIVIPFLMLLFWALGGGKGNQVSAKAGQKGFNSSLPDAKLKDNSALNKMSYYDKAAQDSDKLKQQMKTDPYYHPKADTDTAGLYFPRLNPTLRGSALPGSIHSSRLIGAGTDPAANEAKVYQKLAELQTTINKPALENKPVTQVAADYSSPLKNPVVSEDPQLKQMNNLLEKILDIQHPERVKEKSVGDSAAVATKFKAIPAIVDGKQKITEGSVVRIKILDTVTLSGQLIPKGQLIYGKGMLYNQRLTLNLKIIRIGNTILPVDLTVYDRNDGLEGIDVPEAVTGDAMKDGAASGVQGVEFMSLDPSVTAQLAGAGLNTAKGLFSKKVKRIKAKLKDGHPLLLRVNKNNSFIPGR